ncbi:hypothetical protein K503DRAFT_618250 [Rhizopogon vinicolor AM-OR11-026]|uniref:Uncharacterized protein n=1 Tax=Rhizopogon vinicolor AM-OR11-026 TaxID=1314800 RepID=A0A1B7MIG8_9AGAM|nr:hypothetical protein K503DRAFT_618250 [Rhizopogon vinicolor AM-OR11-026]
MNLVLAKNHRGIVCSFLFHLPSFLRSLCVAPYIFFNQCIWELCPMKTMQSDCPVSPLDGPGQ